MTVGTAVTLVFFFALGVGLLAVASYALREGIHDLRRGLVPRQLLSQILAVCLLLAILGGLALYAMAFVWSNQ